MKNRNRFIRSFAGLGVAAAMCASLPAMELAAAQTLAGDVDKNGSVGVTDVVLLYKYLHKQAALDQAAFDNADVVADGAVNVLDLTMLKKMVVSQPVADAVYIHLKGSSITVEGDDNKAVEIIGTTAKITASGVYYVDGSITDGQLYVETAADDLEDVELYLTGVTFTNSTRPAIYTAPGSGADKTKITFSGKNEMTDVSAVAYTEASTGKNMGVIFSNNKLTFTKNSSGTLTINSSMNHAISCEKKINLNGGTIQINTADLTFDGGSGKADADGINSDKAIEIEGAILNIDASADGIKSDSQVIIYSGDVSVKAGNDAIQAAALIDVQGGNVIASGDRGLRLGASGTLNIDGGSVLATATDYQVNGNETISITGAQAVMLLDMAAEWKKDSAITVNAATYTSNKKYDYVLVSDAGISASGSNKVYIGGQQAKHEGDATGKFQNTGSVTQYKAVDILEGGDAAGGGTAVASVVFNSGGVALYDANGEAIDASAAENVKVSDSTYVTINKSGNYTFSGSCANGQIKVSTDDAAEPEAVVEMSFEGLELSNSTAAPVYIENVGDEAVISAKNGTLNTISDGTSHTDTDGTDVINGAIYSKDDLKLKGKGTLTVNGNCEDGIVCKNDLKLWNGTINVTAVDDGIRGKDSVRIGDPDAADLSTLNVTVKTSGGDGIKSTATDDGKGCITVNGGTVKINSYADGFQAEQAFTMNGGDVDIITYEGSAYAGNGSTTGNNPWGGFGGMQDGNSNKTDISAKGIKAVGLYDTAGTTYQSGGSITINGGTLTVDSSDDCIHAGGNVELVGGALTLSSADDAVHSDHDLTIGKGSANTFSDLTVIIPTCYEGIEGQSITQNSGTVIVNSTDDGYNAAGGADGSGNSNIGGRPGWGQGNMGSGGGSYSLTINGGFALVNATDGDHDGFDSNGSLTIAGGYVISNGNEPFDADGALSHTGGIFVEDTGSGGMGGMMGGGSLSTDVSVSGSVSANSRITVVDGSGNVIISFIADKNVSAVKAGTKMSGVSVYSGGTLNGSTYFQQLDQTQLAAYGGTLSGGTKLG